MRRYWPTRCGRLKPTSQGCDDRATVAAVRRPRSCKARSTSFDRSREATAAPARPATIRATDSASHRRGSKHGGSVFNAPDATIRTRPIRCSGRSTPTTAPTTSRCLRTRALFKVRVPLPSRVRLTDDPLATHVTLSRAVTPLNMLKHTAPYQQDRSAPTLEAQALAAINQHMEPTIQPSQAFLESVAEFQRHIFSSAKVRKLSAAIDRGGPLPNLDPPLTDFEREGKEKFDNFCGHCHGGPAQVQNLENRIFPPFDGSTNPVSINVVVSNPPPQGFPLEPDSRTRLRSRDATVHRRLAERHQRRAGVE